MLLTRDWRTTTIAIVAAYAIVVQALLLATSGAFHAASSSTDPLGILHGTWQHSGPAGHPGAALS